MNNNPHLIDPKSQLTNAMEIPQKKGMTILMCLLAIAFVAGSVFMLIKSPEMKDKIIAIVSILFFGAGSIYFFIKIFDKTPVVIISDEGVVDNSTGISVGFIPWSEVTSIEKLEVSTQGHTSYFVSLKVKNPENLREKKSNPVAKFFQKVNSNMFDSDVSINPQFAKINIDELEQLMKERHAKATKSRQV